MIEKYSFGYMTINGQPYDHDVLVSPGEVKKWWRKDGHNIAKEDLKKALEMNPEIIVIGTGASGMMKVAKEVQNYITTKKIEVAIEVTEKAKDVYNQLEGHGKKVAGLFHLTC